MTPMTSRVYHNQLETRKQRNENTSIKVHHGEKGGTEAK